MPDRLGAGELVNSSRSVLSAAVLVVLTLSACGSDAASTSDTEPPNAATSAAAGIQLVQPDDAAATIATPPDDLVILDVRTPAEFAEGHIEGAVMIDFYRDDFASELAKLDPNVPYVLYCRSGNRSGQTGALMTALGFSAVDDVDGGIIAWQDAGLPLVTE
ncbi:MAG: rhodanese-like domain-containing protein [Ilumatobacter sp.]|jgi:phage shock protein E|nr:rhodanese-like domain-containing protein [Ilumatobacter sp.]